MATAAEILRRLKSIDVDSDVEQIVNANIDELKALQRDHLAERYVRPETYAAWKQLTSQRLGFNQESKNYFIIHTVRPALAEKYAKLLGCGRYEMRR